ncbi:MAG: TetR/AcrR family transcriptional regulator [Candidatus Thorarchaeota archaeon]
MVVISTKNKILDAAITLFTELGYSGTTTRKIAETAGINEVTLFRNFGTKENLFFKALEYLGNQSVGTAHQIFEDNLKSSSIERFQRVGERGLDYLNKNIRFLLMIFNEVQQFPEIKKILLGFKGGLQQSMLRFISQLNTEHKSDNDNSETFAVIFIASILYIAMFGVISEEPIFGLDNRDLLKKIIEFIYFRGING